MSLCYWAPKSDTDATIALITDCQRPFLPYFTIFQVDLTYRSDLENDTDDIDDTRLNHTFNLTQVCKIEAHSLNIAVIVTPLDASLIREGQAIVILDGSESLVCKLH